MTPERIAEIEKILAKTFPNPSEMIIAREIAKELLEECKACWEALEGVEV